jgi:uncharacterized lipoprotein YmbA
MNTMKRLMLIAALTSACLSGCSTDQIARVVYYSFRVENQAVDTTPPLQSRGTPMSFDRYQQERRGDPSR